MKLTQDAILATVFKALDNLNLERDPAHQIPVGVETVLFGLGSPLDSLALVSVISDVEVAVSDELGEAVCLTDDQALSQKVSPYTSVQTLVAYVALLTEGKG